MVTDAQTTGMDPQLLEDYQAAIKHILEKTPLDPAVYQRIKERGERITQRLRDENVDIDIVQILREVRDEDQS